ncbi:MAG: SapC family protein [Thalassotalea sp.]
MLELQELTSTAHKELRIDANSQMTFAASQHLLNIRINEVGQSVCSMPVFLSKEPQQGLWRLSAITSFSPGQSLLVDKDQWLAPYQPTSIQTYPFYFMKSPKEEKAYTIGIDEKNSAFSFEQGLPLFEGIGKASPFLGRIKNLLEGDIQNDINTFHFGQTLAELGLCKAINLLIRYEDESTQKITGLSTINEDKLQTMSAEDLVLLNQKGYLSAIHGMLISILQLNTLIQKNNVKEDLLKIKNIKIEVNK